VSETFTRRLAGAAAVAYVVLAFAGSGLGGSSPDLRASRADIVKWAASRHAGAGHIAGGFLELLAILSLVVFSAAAYSFFRPREQGSGVLSAIVLGGGLLSAGVKIASAMLAFPVYWRYHEGMSPQLTAALVDGNNVGFILTWSLDAVLLAAAAALILRTRALPRWTGWLAGVTAPILLLSTPAANVVPPLGMLLAFLWFVAAGVALAIRRGDRVAVAVPSAI
jgi:hypothetical protein